MHLQIHYLLMDILHEKLRAWENAQALKQQQAYNIPLTEKPIFWAYFKPYVFFVEAIWGLSSVKKQ